MCRVDWTSIPTWKAAWSITSVELKGNDDDMTRQMKSPALAETALISELFAANVPIPGSVAVTDNPVTENTGGVKNGSVPVGARYTVAVNGNSNALT